MQSLQEQQLILDHFEKLKTLEKTPKYKRYLLKDIHSCQRIELKTQNIRQPKPTILHEAGFLQELQGYPGFPIMIWSGNYVSNENGLLTEKMGPNLWELMQRQKSRVFSLATVCLIGLQLVKNLQTMHEKNALLDQVIPQNFRLSQTKVDQILVSNMLHSKRYKSSKTNQLFIQRKLQKLDFFNPFLSFGKLSLRSSCRRDDLESVFYLLVYFKKGVLPWSKVITKNQVESQLKMLQLHKKMVVDQQNPILKQLLDNLPQEFCQIYQHIYNIKFEERPNYCLVRRKLEKVLWRLAKTCEPQLDWLRGLGQGKLLKVQDLQFQTERQSQIERQFFLPYARKVTLDHLSGDHSSQAPNQQQQQIIPAHNYRKEKCQIM